MWSTALYVLLLDALVSVFGELQSSYVQDVAGIFNVTSVARGDFLPCHRCLVLFIGNKRIDLIQASQTYKLYWFYGRYTDLVQAFLS